MHGELGFDTLTKVVSSLAPNIYNRYSFASRVRDRLDLGDLCIPHTPLKCTISADLLIFVGTLDHSDLLAVGYVQINGTYKDGPMMARQPHRQVCLEVPCLATVAPQYWPYSPHPSCADDNDSSKQNKVPGTS